jgi:hypothetical protein
MRNFKIYVSVFMGIAAFAIVSSCNKNELKNDTKSKLEIRSIGATLPDANEPQERCWTCVIEDALGGAEGAGVASWIGGGNPLVIMVGAVGVGFYRSYKEHSTWTSNNSNGDPRRVVFLNPVSDFIFTGNEDNPYDYAGRAHNYLLYKAIKREYFDLDKFDTQSELNAFISTNLNDFTEFSGQTINLDVSNRLWAIHLGTSLTPTSIEGVDQSFITEFKNAAQYMSQAQFLSFLNTKEIQYANNPNIMAALAIAYQSFFFWKKVK